MKSHILAGDCLKLLPTLPDESFDLVLTDPPYGVDYQLSWKTNRSGKAVKKMPKIENDTQPFVWWLPEAFRLLKPDRAVLCFCRWDVAEAFRLAMTWAGFTGVTQLIWDKGFQGLGHLKGRPGPRHETIWFGQKGIFQFEGETRPGSVLTHGRILFGKTRHPNQKPVPLFKELIRDYCPKGGGVLDPFAGSGASLVAAAMLGHPAVGVELDEKYARLAARDLDGAVACRKAGGGKTLKPLV